LYLAVVMSGIADAIRGDHREIEGARDTDGSLVTPFFLALLVALQFDIDVPVTEDPRQPFDDLPACGLASAHKRRSQRPLVASRKTNQAGSILAQIVEPLVRKPLLSRIVRAP
jgi:hypothetical protein